MIISGKKDFDISRNSFGDVDENYSGLMIVQKWNDDYVSVNKIINGRVSKKYNVSNTNTANNIINCNGTLVTEYFRDCEVHIYGDGIVTEECGSWMPTGNEWCFEEDPDSDPCENPESPQCACEGYGLCEGGGDDDEEEVCTQNADEIFSTASVMAEKEETNECGNTGSVRYKCYSWKIYTVSNGAIPMYLKSNDKAVQVKGQDDRWRFQTLTHENIVKGGTEILYSVSTENISSTPTISSHLGMTAQVGRMHLSFTVKVSVICDGLPIVHNDPTTSEMSWHVNE